MRTRAHGHAHALRPSALSGSPSGALPHPHPHPHGRPLDAPARARLRTRGHAHSRPRAAAGGGPSLGQRYPCAAPGSISKGHLSHALPALARPAPPPPPHLDGGRPPGPARLGARDAAADLGRRRSGHSPPGPARPTLAPRPETGRAANPAAQARPGREPWGDGPGRYPRPSLSGPSGSGRSRGGRGKSGSAPGTTLDPCPRRTGCPRLVGALGQT